MSVVAVLPIKQLANAKQRLRSVLDDEQRRGRDVDDCGDPVR